MSNAHPKNKSWGNRIKLALIPVLGVVLAAVMFRPDTPAATDDPATCLKPRIRSPQNGSASAASETNTTWPKANLVDVIAFNPFELKVVPPSPTPTTATVAKAGEATKAEPKNSAPRRAKVGNLQAVYEDGRGAVAIVDGRIVRVGDLVNGCRVVEITREGIVVEGASPAVP